MFGDCAAVVAWSPGLLAVGPALTREDPVEHGADTVWEDCVREPAGRGQKRCGQFVGRSENHRSETTIRTASY